MTDSHSFDVIVVGAGPGGSVAAKRCAESGLQTLLIEKKQLPRDKVCSGMVMGEWACRIIDQEFGTIPEFVLTDPPRLSGHRFYVGIARTQDLEWPLSLAWRRDLDFWMVQEAAKTGVIMREGFRVVGLKLLNNGCRVILQKDGKIEALRARFVIGADGATSVVRRSIFPTLKIRYSGPIRECYRGALNLERNFIHWFFPKGLPRPRFNVNHKDDVFLIEGAGIRELRNEMGRILSRYGLYSGTTPEWKDCCAIPLMHHQLLSGAFRPAKTNVLLIGDAAGLILPITFEGIGSALKSGILAAEAIVKRFDNGVHAASLYINNLDPMLQDIRRLCIVQSELKTASRGSAGFLVKSVVDAYRETLTIQKA